MGSYFLAKYNEALRLRERSAMPTEVRDAYERVMAAYKKCAKPSRTRRRVQLDASR